MKSSANEYDVFLSYARPDTLAAERLRARLAEAGLRAFLDRYALPAGQAWQPQLEGSLASSRALVVLLGPSGLGNWQHREIQLGLDRQAGADAVASFPVIPVLLPGLPKEEIPLGRFLSLNTWIDLRPGLDDAEALQRLVAGVQGQAIDGVAADRLLAALSPYRGLLPFRERDVGLFFGRERFVKELVRKVCRRTGANVVAVIGRSGSGKSSVVFAGLFPALRRERGIGEQAVWEIVSVRPFAEPLYQLARIFAAPANDADPIAIRAELNAHAQHFRRGEVTVAELVRDRLQAEKGSTRLLLYVDQWEELYTQAQPREIKSEEDQRRAGDAQLFVDLLLDAAATAPCTLVLSVRSDFYADIQNHDALRAAIQDNQVSLGPMDKSELQEVIEGPAKAIGGKVQPEFTARLMRDIGFDLEAVGRDQYDISKLPLLEYALEQAWTRRTSSEIGLGQYGGLEQALEDRANDVYERLSTVQQAAAKRLFISLVTPGEGREDTRARITVPADSSTLEVVEAFSGTEARLIVTGEGAGSRSAEVSHEALIRHWEKLRGWIDENRENLRIRAALVVDRADWLKKDRHPSLLIESGLRLEAARKLYEEPGDVVIDDIVDYIEASIKREEKADQERKEHQRKELAAANERAETARQLANEQKARADAEAARADAETARIRAARGRTWVASFLALVMLGAAAVVFFLYERADRERSRAEAALMQAEHERVKAVSAHVASLWSRLDRLRSAQSGDELNALWELRLSDDGIRDAFLSELMRDPQRAGQFARHPDILMRAIRVRWSPAQAQVVLGPLLDLIKQTTKPDRLQYLVQAVQLLPLRLSQEQALGALDQVIKATQQTNDLDQLQYLTQTVQAIAVILTEEEAQAALELLLEGTKNTTHPDRLVALAASAEAVTRKITQKQAEVALRRLLEAIQRAPDPYYLLEVLGQVVPALAAKLTVEQAQTALGLLVDTMNRTVDALHLRILAHAVNALPVRLTQEQAQRAFVPVLDALQRTTEPFRLKTLTVAAQALAGKVTQDQAQEALAQLLDITKNTTNPDQLQALAQAVGALPVKLAEGDARAALDHVVATIRGTTNPDQLQALAQAVGALPVKLTQKQAQAALGPALDALTRATSPYQLRALAQAVGALPVKLTQEQAQAALKPVLDAIKQATKPGQLLAIARTLRALPVRLTQDQAQTALEPVLRAIKQETSPARLNVLSQAVGALPVRLTQEQAQAALEPLLDASPDPARPWDLAMAAQAIAGKLTQEQKLTALSQVLAATKRATDSAQLEVLTVAAQAVVGKLAQDQAQAALGLLLKAINGTTTTNQLRTLTLALDAMPPNLVALQLKAVNRWTPSAALAWAGTADEAATWARVLAADLQHKLSRDRIPIIAEALKYPTSAGAATRVLLNALQSLGAPGEDAGLDDNLTWIGATYPEIDAPPACPAPPPERQQLVCPAVK